MDALWDAPGPPVGQRSSLVLRLSPVDRGAMPQLRRRPPLHTRAGSDAQRRRGDPLPRRVAEQVRASADALAALLAVEGRTIASLDDLEWADAVAARFLARRAVASCPCGRRQVW